MCVSWALTLFFSLSWRKLPWGSFLHGSTREALEQGPTHHIYCICLSLSQLGASVTRSYSPIQGDCSCLSPCVLYLYPSFDGIPTVNSCHLIQAADLKKKNKVNPKAQLQTCACTESNSIPQANNFLPQHTDPQLETLLCHLYLPFLISICSLTSFRWSYSDRGRNAVKCRDTTEYRHCSPSKTNTKYCINNTFIVVTVNVECNRTNL